MRTVRILRLTRGPLSAVASATTASASAAIAAVTAIILGGTSCREERLAPDSSARAIAEARELRSIDPSTSSTVSGVVTVRGALPPATMIRAGGDAACAQGHSGEFDARDLLVRDGKVENAFVWVKSGLDGFRFTAPTGKISIDQRGCMYNPRITGARVDQPIEFTNSDQTLHNISSKPENSRGFNFVTPQGQSGSRAFSKPEVMVRLGCDVHPWMRAWIGIVEHPFFALTGADGRYQFAGLPPGDYVIGAWHERLGAVEQRVSVGPRTPTTLDFELTGVPAALVPSAR